ncbi:MAG: phenylalanine--tRNA ligase subunit beta, partial [Candidatus Omnitrophica bacterium]|nr:phenylalanine--tRNA ligase subunit beta [Candidatus Omnitrophota bacterium]
MKISLKWFKDYIDFGISKEELSKRLTLSGREVEKEETIGNDTTFEFEITPNRPDCLSLLGIARELSAILNKPLKKPTVKKVKFPKNKCDVTVTDAQDCPRYIGAVLKNVHVAASAPWLKEKIISIGARSVNNIVDLTNFCLMETGQPMHAFDLDKLAGGKIIVRRAKQGEKILAINDVEYTLDPSILVIADEKKPVAIAGIMGGKQTEVTEKTKNILLESAYFNPMVIRRASRKLALRSDSSYRFERGVDMKMVEGASGRAINLIVKEAKAEPFSFRDVYKGRRTAGKSMPIVVDAEKISNFLGTDIPLAKIKNILTKLEFKTSSGPKGKLKVLPPSFRLDIKSDVDVIEEIARILGYDRLLTRLVAVNPLNIETDPKRIFKEKLAGVLVGQGLNEVICYSMVGAKDLAASKVAGQGVVYNQNPLSEEQEIMRPSCAPSMLNVTAHNFKNGQKDLRLFEIGKIYLPSGEKDVVSIILTGKAPHDWRQPQARAYDFYDSKGIVERIFEALKIEALSFTPVSNPSLEKDESVSIVFKGKEIGFLGRVEKEILEKWDIKHQNVFIAQFFIEALRDDQKNRVARYAPLGEYPGVV